MAGVIRVSIRDGGLEVSANLQDQGEIDKLIRILTANKELLESTKPAAVDIEDDSESRFTQGVTYGKTENQIHRKAPPEL